jgi:DNA-binding response OmpR family regulator
VTNQVTTGQPGQTGNNNVLLLCSNASLRAQYAESLLHAGYRVTQRAQSAQVLVQLTDYLYDILVLDLDAVQSDPIAFMQAVRKLQPELQLVILTQHPTLRTSIAAIRVGSIDYLILPTDTAVIIEAVHRAHRLVMRLKTEARALPQSGNPSIDSPIKWPQNGEGEGQVLVVPPARLDFSRREAILYDDPTHIVELSRGETAILASLMRTPDQPLRAEQIARVAWKYSLHPLEAGELVRPYIFRLRRKLEERPEEPKMILTLRGRGYMFASLDYSPPTR